MAMGLGFTCECGARIRAYVPKALLFQALTGRSLDWGQVDFREQQDGAVRRIRLLAEQMGQTFLDLTGGGSVCCAICGRRLEVLERLRHSMVGGVRYRRAG